jgi:hypothetical protein
MAELKQWRIAKVQVTKFSEELGILWGWGSVADIVDLDGDVIPQDELVKAVYKFMEDYHVNASIVDENHDYEPADAVIVESTLQFIAGTVRWFIGLKLLSQELRDAAKSGQISGFSIGGYATPVEEG